MRCPPPLRLLYPVVRPHAAQQPASTLPPKGAAVCRGVSSSAPWHASVCETPHPLGLRAPIDVQTRQRLRAARDALTSSCARSFLREAVVSPCTLSPFLRERLGEVEVLDLRHAFAKPVALELPTPQQMLPVLRQLLAASSPALQEVWVCGNGLSRNDASLLCGPYRLFYLG